MRKSRFTEEQVIRVLQQVDSGQRVKEVCREHGVSEGTYYRWKAKFGGMDVGDVPRQANEQWSMDFMSDTLAGGRCFWPRISIQTIERTADAVARRQSVSRLTGTHLVLSGPKE